MAEYNRRTQDQHSGVNTSERIKPPEVELIRIYTNTNTEEVRDSVSKRQIKLRLLSWNLTQNPDKTPKRTLGSA